MIDLFNETLRAEKRIRSYIRETPLESSPNFDGLQNTNVFFKCENLQYTGSFKVRGALSKGFAIQNKDLLKGVVTASTGNHGAATAFALSKIGYKGTIFVPENASKVKIFNIERHGGIIKFHGADSGETEFFARNYAKKNNLIYLPPYNDPQVIGGQGTIAIELKNQLKKIDAVFVSIGGGGLISGIALYLKHISPETKIIGCSPRNSQVMIQSVKKGNLINYPSKPTISDGTAGGVELDSITFPIVKNYVDELLTVSESQIFSAIKKFMNYHPMTIEGSAGVSIAGYLSKYREWLGKNVVIVLCGANISLENLKKVLNSKIKNGSKD